LEKATPQDKILKGKYEDNGWYYSRNTLTTLAIVLLTAYTTNTGILLSSELNKHEEFKTEVRLRVITLCSLIDVVLLLRLGMIWSANAFWYGSSKVAWPMFVAFYQLLASFLPLIGFLYVLVQQICQLHK